LDGADGDILDVFEWKKLDNILQYVNPSLVFIDEIVCAICGSTLVL